MDTCPNCGAFLRTDETELCADCEKERMSEIYRDHCPWCQRKWSNCDCDAEIEEEVRRREDR